VQLRAAEKPNARRARFRALRLRFAPALDSRPHEATPALLSKANLHRHEVTAKLSNWPRFIPKPTRSGADRAGHLRCRPELLSSPPAAVRAENWCHETAR
jgi:hypothetical protein